MFTINKTRKNRIRYIFVNIINKSRYNLHYKIINNVFNFKFIIYFCFYQSYIISNLFNKKLFNQRVKLFKILKIIDNFKQTYRLKFFLIIKIYSIIFIAQLKSTTLNLNLYNKFVNNNSSLIEKKIRI